MVAPQEGYGGHWGDPAVPGSGGGGSPWLGKAGQPSIPP